MKTKTCDRCKGKGRTYDLATLVIPLTWIVAAFERNDPRGVSRERCRKCGGTGRVAR